VGLARTQRLHIRVGVDHPPAVLRQASRIERTVKPRFARPVICYTSRFGAKSVPKTSPVLRDHAPQELALAKVACPRTVIAGIPCLRLLLRRCLPA
jgi:hypothetical protein